MPPAARRWPVGWLVVACVAVVVARASLSRECSAERRADAIIDINLSLPRGVRGWEPVSAPSPAACLRACCSGQKPAGDKKCNLMIFDAQRTSTHPNCYLFYCPSTEACPMKPATGYVSYKITRDTHVPEDTSFKSEDFSSNGYSLSSDTGAFLSGSQTSPQNPTAALQQSVFHQASELLNHVVKHLDNLEFHTLFPESQGAKHPESLDPIPRQKAINLPPNTSSAVQIGSPSALFPTAHSTAPEPTRTTLISLPTSATHLASHTTSQHPVGAKATTLTTTTTTTSTSTTTTAAFPPAATTGAKPRIPATTIAVTHVPLSSPTASASVSATKWVPTNSRSATTPSGLRTPATPPEPTVVSSNNASHVTLLSFPGFTLSTSDSPTSFQNNPQDYGPSDSESYLPESFLRAKGVVQLGEKSSLIAALLFGVIFLLLVIALTGKKIHESLQKRHYTRLDYLINGMYAEV